MPAFADDCPQPGPAPAVPDGATATVDQMKAAHEAIQSYVNLLQSEQDCVETRIKIAPKGHKGRCFAETARPGECGDSTKPRLWAIPIRRR